MYKLTKAVKWLLIANIVTFLLGLTLEKFANFPFTQYFGLVPILILKKGFIWQFGTYMFYHANMFHFLFNMLVLAMVGIELENTWGSKFLTKYYFICGVGAAVLYTALAPLFGASAMAIPVIGASGALYGLMLAYGIIFGNRDIYFMMILPMKAKHFILILFAIEVVSTIFYSNQGVANLAHLGGMIVGLAYLSVKVYLKLRANKKAKNPSGGLFGRKKGSSSQKSHLKLVVNNQDSLKLFDDDDKNVDKTDPKFWN